MAAPNTITNDTTFTGNVTFTRAPALAAGSIDNTDIAAGSTGNYIAATKLDHQFAVTYTQADGSNIASTSGSGALVHTVYGATGSVVAVKATIFGTIMTGDRTVTIDVKKSTGGAAFATVLTATVVLDTGNTVRTPESGTVLSDGTEDLVAGDILVVQVTVAGSTGTQPQGLGVTVTLIEDPL